MMASFNFRHAFTGPRTQKPILYTQAHPQTIQVMQKLGAHSKSFKKTVCH